MILALMLTLPALPAIAAPPSVQWRGLSSVPAVDLTGVAYGNGSFVAVGAGGTILVSANGTDWAQKASGTELGLKGVAYGNGLFVAYGDGNPAYGLVLTSPDGDTWTRRSAGRTVAISDVTFCGNRFVANMRGWEPGGPTWIGTLTSQDGMTWTVRKDEQAPESLVCGDGRLLAAGGTAQGVSVWTENGGRVLRPGPGFPAWHQENLVYGNGRFMLMQSGSDLAAAERGAVLQSTDGVTWSRSTGFQWNQISVMAHVGDRFLAAGAGWSGPDSLLSSVDGLSWTPVSVPAGFPPAAIKDFAYGGGTYVAVGQQGRLLTSTDGNVWSDHGARATSNVFDVRFGLDRFVALDDSDRSVWMSTDGVAWQHDQPFGDKQPGSLNFLNGQFVVVADLALMTSTDGRSWSEFSTLPAAVREMGGGTRISLTYGNGRYVAYTSARQTWSSPDGKTWQIGQEALPGPVSQLVYAQGRFLATIWRQGANWRDQYTELYTSTDGLAWAPVAGSARQYAVQSACNGKFAGTTPERKIGISTDGTAWDTTEASAWRVFCAGDRFVASDTGHLLVSATGDTWAEVPSVPGWTAESVAYGKGRYVLAGSGGLFTSEPLCGGVFDLPAGHEACGAITRLSQRGIMQGFPDSLFRPGDRLTRAQAAKLVVVTLGKAPDPAGALPFPDTRGHWAAMQGYVQAAVAARAIAGYLDGSFRPEGPVTRAELVKMIAAAAGLTAGGAAPYSDIHQDDWMRGWVAAAYEAGLIGPRARTPVWTASAFSPGASVTRAEAAILLDNYLAYQAK